METLYTDGYCPECQLNNKEVELLLNKDDFWECPESNLQLAVFGNEAVTLKFRGIGKFKEEPSYGTHNIEGAALAQALGSNYYSDISIFNSSEEFKSYLAKEVEPQLELTLQNLAVTYIKYKYSNQPDNAYLKRTYKRQSKFFKIDFENKAILQKLEKRDTEEDMPLPRSFTHLYSLLFRVFQNYQAGNTDWLPEQGMSLNQLELCNKHLRTGPEPVTNINDKEIIRHRLLEFIVDVIEIVYRGKAVESVDTYVKPSEEVAVSHKAEPTLTLQDILNLKTDLFKNAKVKLVRHKDNRKEYRELIKDRNELLLYQKTQSKEVYKGCDYIVSFTGQAGTKALLFGIFKVNGVSEVEQYLQYDLEEVDGFDYLTDRVVIDWGKNTRNWHQWYHSQPKEIIQIFPKGYLGSFPGLLNFVLEYDELHKLINNPAANQDWKNSLSNVNGIYMILDTRTGGQYIGSAYGGEGIWQRWCVYANCGHGNNKKLIELCETEPNYFKNFRFSVLQTLPSNTNDREVIAIENLYKQKFGTRAVGLGLNCN